MGASSPVRKPGLGGPFPINALDSPLRSPPAARVVPTAALTRKNFYKDSVALMRISQTVGGREGLTRVSLLMGTPANKDILGQAGLLVPELAGAAPADLLILVEGEPGALPPAPHANGTS